MAETNLRNMIDLITADKLRKNLAWNKIRILHRDYPSDYFARYLWDGRVSFINSGGSHHFTATRYIASRIGASVPLRGKLHTDPINEMAVASLQRDYEMFVIARHLQKPHSASTMPCRALAHPTCGAPVPGQPCHPRTLNEGGLRMREAGFLNLGLYLCGLATQQTHSHSLP